MWCVYVIRSVRCPGERYIGLAHNPRERLRKHNEGASAHTSKFRPWELDLAIGFKDKTRAVAFERYLKSGAGFAFARRHF